MDRSRPEPSGRSAGSTVTAWEARKRILFHDETGRLNRAEIRAEISTLLAEAIVYSVDDAGAPRAISPALAKRFRKWFEALPDADALIGVDRDAQQRVIRLD